ncbi:GntR family transcriptional regulator [Streptomyces viridochromogenes]|uniref:Putative GntR family transcriptional regulator n=1 Tax=Streptomyces viridochromogenes Tue57 TaxID=1160705 RepID=L8P748_STRVR|nr:GntR family transcriptional regulator [Streptomyces viridochromogenes]ELS51102.1 putative GntR family transcriptional regulator [Streptomyces viridochromogenes Tue57]
MSTATPAGRGRTPQQGLDDLTPVNLRSTPALIADRLREQIVSGAFAPGSRMVEPQLGARLGVSRGPVREALQRLVQEGLLINIPNRGVFVVELDAADIKDIYTARRAIEREAATRLHRSKSRAHLDRLAAVVEEMRALAGQGDSRLVAEQDLAFHSALVDAAESPRLSRMFTTLLAETRICLASLMDLYPEQNLLVAEHQQLLGLLRGEDEHALLDAVNAHLDSAVRDLTRSGEH